MPGRNFDNSNYCFAFNGQEKDDELTGLGNTTTAMFWEYDTRTGRRWNLDPKPIPSLSIYSCFINNPLLNIDVYGDRAGDFLNEKGALVGNDGKADGKLYLIKTTKKFFENGVKSAGISNKEAKETEDFIKNNSGNTKAFENNVIAYKNSVEMVGVQSTRQSMFDIISKDDGLGGNNGANNREYGGRINNDMSVYEANPGSIVDPSKSSTATINITITPNTLTVFHSHASGDVGKKPENQFESFSNYSTFIQSPSQDDIKKADGAVRYEFGRANGTTYLYNNKGVLGTIPTKHFVNLK